MRHFILITDPGRDIDDALAILAMLGDPNVSVGMNRQELQPSQNGVVLDAIITSGGNNATRAAFVHRLLDMIGVPSVTFGGDSDATGVVVAAADEVAGIGREECAIPPSFGQVTMPSKPQPNETNRISASTLVLISFLEKWGSDAFIVAIGPLTPLHSALRECPDGRAAAALASCGGLFAQAQAKLGNGGMVVPDDACFNFREDMQAAVAVLKILVDAQRPVRLLGKHAAYAVKVTRADLAAIDGACREKGRAPFVSNACEAVMNVFRVANPELFYRLYPNARPPIPEADDDEGVVHSSCSWFDRMDVCAHPYDPLLVMWAVETMAASSFDDAPSQWMEPESLTPFVRTVGGTPERIGLKMDAVSGRPVVEPELLRRICAGACYGL